MLTYIAAAVSLQGSVAEPVPYGPNLRSQVAASFAGLVGPGGAGGFALTARFLERAGVTRAEAGTSVAVNALAGFAVHAVPLVGFVVWTGRSDLGSFSLPSTGAILIVVAVLIVLVGIVVGVEPVRRRIAHTRRPRSPGVGADRRPDRLRHGCGRGGVGHADLPPATFWLPILPGWAALGWMQRRGEL